MILVFATRLALAVAALSLAGCGHVPVTSVLALRKTDFMTTDPANLRAAVKLPRGLRPRETQLTLIVVPADGGRHERSFVLKEMPITDELSAVAVPGMDEQVFAFAVEPADLPRLTAFRSEMKAMRREASGRSSLTLNVGSKACRDGGLTPGQPVMMTTYLKTGETDRFVPLLRDMDLREAAKPHSIESVLPPCDAKTG